MKPHAHTRMLTHSNMHTHTYTYHGKVDTESTWDLERRREMKKGRKSTWHQRNVLKTRHCKLLPCTSRHCGAHVYMNSLRMEAASFCDHSVFAHCFWRTQRASSPTRTPTEECRAHRKDGAMGGYVASSWGSQRGESSWAGLWLCFQSVDSDETLQNIRRVLRFE